MATRMGPNASSDFRAWDRNTLPNTGDYITVFWQVLEMGEKMNERGSVAKADQKKGS